MILESFARFAQLESQGKLASQAQKIARFIHRESNSYVISPEYKPFENCSDLLLMDIPLQLATMFDKKYRVYGSFGNANHNRAQIPWVGIVDMRYTSTVTKNYCITHMLSRDRTKLVVGIACGVHFKSNKQVEQDPVAEKRVAITSERLRNLLKESSPTIFSDLHAVIKPELGGTTGIPKGYEHAFVLNTSFPLVERSGISHTYETINGSLGMVEQFQSLVTQYEEERYLKTLQALKKSYEYLLKEDQPHPQAQQPNRLGFYGIGK